MGSSVKFLCTSLLLLSILSVSMVRAQNYSQNQKNSVFSDSWIPYKPSAGKTFYFSETAITPEKKPFLTCMARSGDTYVLGSRSMGLFTFSLRGRRFRPLPSGGMLTEKKVTAVAYGATDKEIWAGTMFNGLYHRRPDGRWENFGEKDGISGSSITSILPAGNTVWIGTDQGISRVVNSVVSPTSVRIKVFGLAYDRNTGRCYAGHSSSRLSVFDPSSSRWTTVDMRVQPPMTFNHLLIEPSGDILCGGFSGLYRVSGRTGQVVSLSTLPSQKLVSCLSMGDDGVVYVGLLGKRLGVHSLEGGRFNNIFHGTGVFTQTNAVSRTANGHWVIISFGRLWHFTDRFVKDGTLGKADFAIDSQSSVSSPSFASRGSVRTPVQPVGTVGRGFAVSDLPTPPASGNQRGIYSGNNPVPSSPAAPPSGGNFLKVALDGEVTALCNTVSRIWAGTSSGRLYTITSTGAATLARTFNSPITHLYYSSSGRLYIVAGQRELHIFTGFSYKSAGTVPNNVLSIADDGSSGTGAIWIGTERGLFQYNGSTISPFSASASLPDKYIAAIVSDGDTLWAGTRLGLCQYAQGRWTVYGTSDGLPSKNVQAVALLRGRLWACTDDGVSVFTGRRFNVINRFAATDLSIYDTHAVAGSEQGLVSFSAGRWGNIIPLPSRRLSSLVNTGAVVAVGLEDGLYLIERTKL